MDKFRLTECQTLDIPVGNDVPLLVKLVKGFDGCDGEGAVPFPIDVCENVVVAMVSERGLVKSVAHRLGTDGEVLLELQAGDFRAGLTYGIDVRATLNGKAVHAYGKSLVRITAATERGPRQVAQAADPYEVTLQVGYVGDLIPRRLDELEGYDELMDEVDGKANAAAVDKALEAVGREFQKYIPLAQKAVAGGVASLNGEKKVPTDQLQFPLRGQLTPSQIDSTSLADGVYQVNGKVISPDILGGAQANGVLVQYPWDSRVQTLFVGRAAAHADGEQVEIYTRRYLPTPKRWTAWMRIDGGGGGVAELMIPVAWAELVGMRNRGELVPGMQYRITDYVATTTQAETQSANRPFDIIVTADSATTLSEWARATHHDGCDGAGVPFWNSRLNQWLLRYSLDNDTSRFAWADTQNGKGVVYWMRDEWGNEMPFDFKGILFYHQTLHNNGMWSGSYYYFAFSIDGTHDNLTEVYDASLDGTARRNTIKPYEEDGVKKLNNIIFAVTEMDCSDYTNDGILDNHIDANCHDIVLIGWLYYSSSSSSSRNTVGCGQSGLTLRCDENRVGVVPEDTMIYDFEATGSYTIKKIGESSYNSIKVNLPNDLLLAGWKIVGLVNWQILNNTTRINAFPIHFINYSFSPSTEWSVILIYFATCASANQTANKMKLRLLLRR